MVHLHVHTSGSQLDGACDIKKLVQRVKELDMRAIGITDHGNMIKTLEFQLECQKENIKPIIGCEFYMGDQDTQDKFHLICLAKNNTGLKNLYKLNAYAYKDNFYKKPRITFEKLVECKEGLIVTTACIGSKFGTCFLKGEIAGIKCSLLSFRMAFGEDFYVEIQVNNMPEQARYNHKMIELARELEIDVIVTCDAHYINKEDFEAHDTLLCMQTKKEKSDTNRFKFTCNDFYIKRVIEIYNELLSMGIDKCLAAEAIQNTDEIARKCNAEIQINQDFMPHIASEEEEPKMLAELCNAGFNKRYKEGAFEGLNIQDVVNRISYELKVIKQKVIGYFLICLIIQLSKRESILRQQRCLGSEAAT